MAKKAEEAKAYEWDYAGACAPNRDGSWPRGSYHSETFSLGIFQWLPKSRSKGLKRGKVVERVKGWSVDAGAAYDKADARIAELNAKGEGNG